MNNISDEIAGLKKENDILKLKIVELEKTLDLEKKKTSGTLENKLHENPDSVVINSNLELNKTINGISDTLNFNKKIFEAAPIGIAVYQNNGQCITANDVFAKIIGTDKEQVLCQNFRELNSWKQHGLLLIADEVLKNGGTKSKEVFIATTFGKSIWLDMSFSSFISNDEPHLLMMMYDITERKNIENALAESEENFRLLFENSIDAILITHTDGRIFHANPAAVKIYGWTEEELCKFGREKLVDKTDPKFNDAFKERELTGQFLSEFNNIRKDGTIFPIEASSKVYTQKNGEKRTILIFRDITERKKTELALKESEEKFRLTFEMASIGETLTTCNGEFLKVNDTFAAMLGYSKEELCSMKFLDVTFPEDSTKSMESVHRLLSREKEVDRLEKRYITKNGNVVWADVNITLLYDPNNNPLYFITHIIDISERKRVEEEIKKYNEELKLINASKDKFFSIISHDLRGPFLGMLGITKVLYEESNKLTEDEIKNYHELLHKSTGNLYNLIENLLQWSRLQLGRVEINPVKIDLGLEVDDIISLYLGNAKNKDIVIVNNIEELHVKTDKNMFASILQNLISNAIKFTNRNSTIEITAVKKDRFVEISIKDTGVGIAEINLNKLFVLDNHHTTKGTMDETGTGLGLILCKELVEKQGCRIWAESQIGKGSTFVFTLPAAD